MNRRVVALAASVLVACAVPALAQTASPVPSPSPSAPAAPNALPTVPPGIGGVVEGILQRLAGDATAGYGIDPNHVRGVVTYFRRFTLQIRMPLNRYRDIHLHQGTIINPRGATLRTGSVVDVVGHPNADGTLEADQITLIQ